MITELWNCYVNCILCQNCQSAFQYDDIDVYTTEESLNKENGMYWYFVKCPECGYCSVVALKPFSLLQCKQSE